MIDWLIDYANANAIYNDDVYANDNNKSGNVIMKLSKEVERFINGVHIYSSEI